MAKVKKCDDKLFFKLLDTIGVSGNERNIRELIKKAIKPYVDEVKIDNLGNLIARKKGPRPRIMLAAHMDEVGLAVRHIHKSGRIEIEKVGGVDSLTLLGQQISLDLGKNKKIRGVISTGELSTGQIMEEIPELRNLFLDTGLTKKELLKMGVSKGTPITFDPNACYLGKKDIIMSKAIDDRAGCFTLIELAKRLKTTKAEIFYVFTVQEEVGLYGARTSAYSVEPDWGIAIDVADAEDYVADPIISVGGGPVLTIMDSELISNKSINKWIENAAKKIKVDIQKSVNASGTTDATDIALSRGGVPSTVLGVAVRNMHSAVSVVSMSDIDKSVAVLHELLKNPKKKTEVN
jgi:tetrahedral aminopeptidase